MTETMAMSMTDRALRVAFFPDTYDEINGVANTSRQFESFALRRKLPFLTVRGGTHNEIEQVGSVLRVTRRRGRFGFAVDKKHDFDLAFWRHLSALESVVREFDPDIVHITGPSDVGQLGVAIAHRSRIPLAASWHTSMQLDTHTHTHVCVCILPEASLMCVCVVGGCRLPRRPGSVCFKKPHKELDGVMWQRTRSLCVCVCASRCCSK